MDEQHRSKFSHICPEGMQVCEVVCLMRGESVQCTVVGHDKRHMQDYFHVLRVTCPKAIFECNGDSNHMALFSHPGKKDVPPICGAKHTKYEQESQRDAPHFVTEFVHAPDTHPCDPQGLNAHIDFHANHLWYQKQVKPSILVTPKLVELLRRFRPVHRCTIEIFKSMIVHGSLISSSHMKGLREPKQAAKELQSHPLYHIKLQGLKNPGSVEERKVLSSYSDAVIDRVYAELTLKSTLSKTPSDKALIRQHEKNLEEAKQQEAVKVHSIACIFATEEAKKDFTVFCEAVGSAGHALGHNIVGLQYEVDEVGVKSIFRLPFSFYRSLALISKSLQSLVPTMATIMVTLLSL
jgi:hypothetical protein